LEVRRILLEHLAYLDGRSAAGIARHTPPVWPQAR